MVKGVIGMRLLKTSSVELGCMGAIRKLDPQALDMSGKSVFYMCFDGKTLGLSARFWQQSVTIHAVSESMFDGAEDELSGIVRQSRIIRSKIDPDVFKDGPYDVLVWWGMKSKEDFIVLDNIKGYFRSSVLVEYDPSLSKHVPSWMSSSFFGGRGVAVGNVNEIPLRPKRSFSVELPKVVEAKPEIEKPAEESKPEKTIGHQDVVVGELKIDVTSLPTNIDSTSTEVQEHAEPAPKKKVRKKRAVKKKPERNPAPKKSVSVQEKISKMSDNEIKDLLFMISGEMVDDIEEARAKVLEYPEEELSVVI